MDIQSGLGKRTAGRNELYLEAVLVGLTICAVSQVLKSPRKATCTCRPPHTSNDLT